MANLESLAASVANQDGMASPQIDVIYEDGKRYCVAGLFHVAGCEIGIVSEDTRNLIGDEG